MDKISVVFNRLTNTLDVWFDDPEKEWISEETGEEVILKDLHKNINLCSSMLICG